MADELLARQLPQSLEAEQAVIGAMLIDPACVAEVIELLRPEDFYAEEHQRIFETIYSMFNSARKIDPVTEVEQAEDSSMEMETTQIGGVDSTHRTMSAKLAAGAKLRVRERLLTDGSQQAFTDFDVSHDGEGSGCDLISRSVAKESSHQEFRSVVRGNCPCTGHSECDAIIMGHGTVNVAPELAANHEDAALIHEAAIGKIAGEQILKLCTLGLTEEEAEAKIVEGFLR